ncbi:prepilin-type N-terminal cleavage/methylation domain-containing protein [Psychrobacter sp. HD31]|uniref:type IV pilin protein n=1 Tax=Psychrobacter sp. HD31 TaxID=3112003 RepID=UPI003DA6578D
MPVKNNDSHKRYQTGFTLIELLIVLFILAVLSVIAMPSYRQYALTAKQSQVKVDMLRLSAQLESWRSQTLTYRGFVPKNGYDNKAFASVNSPLGSSNDMADYHITLKTIKNGQATVLNDELATNWVMLATPTQHNKQLGLYSYALTSTGVQCANNTLIKVERVWALANCGERSSPW